MNTPLWSWGNAKQTHLQLNIHLTFGLEFEVLINFHIPCIIYWGTCPNVHPLGCVLHVVLCHFLWREGGEWGKNCPVKYMKVWTPHPQSLQWLFSTFISFIFFSMKVINMCTSRNQIPWKSLWWKPSDTLHFSLLIPFQFLQENLL